MLLEEVRPDLSFSRELQEVISKALEKNSDDRYSTILQMQYALKKIDIVETPAVWARPKRASMDLKSFKTILPGEITSWNLITSHRRGDEQPETPRGIFGQIVLMCVLGFFVVIMVLNPNSFFLILPFFLFTGVVSIWLAKSSKKPAELPPAGYGKIATLPKD